MKYGKYPVQPFRMDDEPSEEKEEKPQTDPGMLMKKLEKYFFETRTVQLWGVVDDRSAKDII
ncbi:MAG TPA: ATP-dependent Clp protease proteolytic subunit, partial [Puia sp.]|nr:ATP-dependent Clp protease proteolytic subunit [Puia sp.]